jgi:hypothetical protein
MLAGLAPPAAVNSFVNTLVRTGVISLEEVCRRYELSVEEFHAWQRASTVMMFCSSSAVIPKAPAIKRSALASSRSRAIRL